MPICYRCGIPLTPANRSVEHIIPNAIGGTWKSSDLWCADCNRHFGNTIDAVLCRDLAPIAAMLEVERERGEHQLIRNAVTDSGKKYHIGPGSTPVNVKPVVEIDREKQTIHISARDMDEMKLLLKQLKRKFPKLNIADAESKFVVNYEYVDEPLTTPLSVGGHAFNQAILKIAVCAWLNDTHDPVTIGTALADLNCAPEAVITYIKHYYTRELCTVSADSVEHIVYIQGDSDKQILYAYIELFSSYAFVVNLNEHYTGPEYKMIFRQDVLTGIKSQDIPPISYSGKLPHEGNLNDLFISFLQSKLARVLSIADRKAESFQIRRIAERAFHSVMNKHARGTEIDDEMMAQIESETIRLAKEYALHQRISRQSKSGNQD